MIHEAIPHVRPRPYGGLLELVRERFDSCGMRSEHFHAVYLDRSRRFVGERMIDGAGTDVLRLRMRHIFADALARGADGLIVAHNHPSGSCLPSRHDIEATRRLSAIARALDIELIDHFIITDCRTYSMRGGGEL